MAVKTVKAWINRGVEGDGGDATGVVRAFTDNGSAVRGVSEVLADAFRDALPMSGLVRACACFACRSERESGSRPRCRLGICDPCVLPRITCWQTLLLDFTHRGISQS